MATNKIQDRNYLFATARVRGKEKNLLSRDKAEKMIEAKTAEDALKVLYDLEYGSGEPVEPHDFEVLLTGEHKAAYDFIMSVAPDKRCFTMFLYPADYHNLKSILKAEFQGTDPAPLLMETGSIEPAKLQVMVRDRNLIGLTQRMRHAVTEVIDVFSRTGDPQSVDIILDKACYGDMADAAAATKNKFFIGYVKLLIDTINLKSFVRLRRVGKGWDFFGKVFLPGGNIQEKLFVASYDEPLEQVAERMQPYGLQQVLLEGAASLKESGRYTLLEKLCDDKLMDYIRDSKYKAYGAEALVGYLLAKESEIKTARIIMAGKLAGLQPELIRERLRETYV